MHVPPEDDSPLCLGKDRVLFSAMIDVLRKYADFCGVLRILGVCVISRYALQVICAGVAGYPVVESLADLI